MEGGGGGGYPWGAPDSGQQHFATPVKQMEGVSSPSPPHLSQLCFTLEIWNCER